MARIRKIDLVLTGKNLDGDTKFVNPQARKLWAEQYGGEQWTCTFRLIGGMNDKARMFAYLHGPLLDTCLAHFESTGQYDFIDTTQLYYDFKNMFAKFMRYNHITKKEEESIYDYSSDEVPVDLLKKFLDDIIRFCEEIFPPQEGLEHSGFTAPDSENYKVKKKYGKDFKPVKTYKPDQ
jgi:hypothetical protein